jgi:hypothetical protein
VKDLMMPAKAKPKYALGWHVQLDIGGRTIGPIGRVVGLAEWLDGTTSYILSIVDRNTGAPEQFQVREYEIGARHIAPLPTPAAVPAAAPASQP